MTSSSQPSACCCSTWCSMRNENALLNSFVTAITSDLEPPSLEWLKLKQPRLGSISSGYWTPFETRSQGFVSPGSSTLLPSAVLRPAELHQSFKSTRFVTLTPEEIGSTILIVSQTACQLLASIDLFKGSGLTTRSLLTFWPPNRILSNLRLSLSNKPRRKLYLPAQHFV